MALPDVIPVRYTEEEAGYVSFRPVVRQAFRSHELLDMIVSVTGKDRERIKQVLRSGTVVFHFFRYWWDGFEIDDAQLESLLAAFPDDDPARAFRPELCALVIIERGVAPRRVTTEITRGAASRKRFLRRRNVWDALLAAAAAGPLRYAGYSYMHHADLYRMELGPETRAKLAAAVSVAPRSLQTELAPLQNAGTSRFRL